MSGRDVVIVGGGPAGTAAAIALAEAGVPSTLIDENADIGGQIYREPPKTLRADVAPSASLYDKRRADLRSRFAAAGDKIELLNRATVWGIFPPRKVALSRDDGWEMIDPANLVLAPGTYEYLPPFPGWTLSGVMTPGAAQSMVKTMGVMPGRRVLLAGSGPFLLVVARQLLAAGVELVGLIEAAPRRRLLRNAAGLLACPQLVRDGICHMRAVRRAKVPIFFGHLVVEARGAEAVCQVGVAPCADGKPRKGKIETLEVDTLCIGYGFVPRTDLAQLAGCRMQYDEQQGGWTAEVNGDRETSVENVWVAGDAGGVAGALAAETEGTLVGLAVARRVGALAAEDFAARSRPLIHRLDKLGRFAAALDRIYRPPAELCELPNDDTILCRCEEVSREEVEKGIRYGGSDLRTLKVMTRLGMGPCQGRMCWPAVARLVARRTGLEVAAVGPRNVRPPIVPVNLDELSRDSTLEAAEAAAVNHEAKL